MSKNDSAGSIRHLVFQGGGVKGMAYVGAVEVLEERGLLDGVTHAAGASAGAITAALLAAGAGSRDLDAILRDTQFSSFKDGKGLALRKAERLHSEWGIHPGDVFNQWLRTQLATLTERATSRAQPDMTFAELRALAAAKPGVFRELTTVTTNLTKQMPEVFSADATPDVPIALAVRMSMSIPLFFRPVTFRGCVYVDGGVSWNYPIDLFDGLIRMPVVGFAATSPIIDEARAAGTLGFSLGTPASIAAARNDWAPLPVTISDVEDLVGALASFLIQDGTRMHLDARALARTVFIDNAGVATTDFDLTPEQMTKLVENGRNATRAYFEARGAV